MNGIGKYVLPALFASTLVCAQNTSPAGVPARMIVSVGHFYSEQAPVLTRDSLTLTQGIESLSPVNVAPLRGPVELFLLVDNCSSCEPGAKFEELRKFIASQSPTTTIGIGYIRDGNLEIALKPTADRDLAVKNLNPPTGSKPSNPFAALAELIKQWPPDSARHVVLMISNGIDPEGSAKLRNPTAEEAIEQAQRAAVPVFAMYHPSADYVTADWEKLYSGQIQLAHVATETGGEAYFLGFGPMPSLAPFLADVADHLANQYQIDFLAKPEAAGRLEEVSVRSNSRDVEIMAPAKVFIPAIPAHAVTPGK